MPPKKKGGKKKSKKKKTPKMSPEEEVAALKDHYHREKQQERIKVLNEENDTLKGIAKELRARLERAEQMRSLMTILLKNRVEDLEGDNKKMISTQEELVQTKERVAQEKLVELEQVRQKYNEEIKAKDKKCQELAAKYEQLAHFDSEQANMQATMELLQNTLEDERRRHLEQVEVLDRINMQQKEWLKKEMLNKIRETKLSLLAMTEDQLHTTTKRTIEENEQMTTELQYQSRETERVVRRNMELEKANRDMRRSIRASEEEQMTLAKRTQFFQKYIKKLNEKIRLAESRNAATAHHGKRSTTTAGNSGFSHGTGSGGNPNMRRTTHSIRSHASGGGRVSMDVVHQIEQKLQLEQLNYQGLSHENEKIRLELTAAHKTSTRIISLQDEGTSFLLSCVEDVKHAIRKEAERKQNDIGLEDMQEGRGNSEEETREGWDSSKPLPAKLDDLNNEERLNFLHLLLAKLSYHDGQASGSQAGSGVSSRLAKSRSGKALNTLAKALGSSKTQGKLPRIKSASSTRGSEASV